MRTRRVVGAAVPAGKAGGTSGEAEPGVAERDPGRPRARQSRVAEPEQRAQAALRVQAARADRNPESIPSHQLPRGDSSIAPCGRRRAAVPGDAVPTLAASRDPLRGDPQGASPWVVLLVGTWA